MKKQYSIVIALLCAIMLAGCTARNVPGRQYGQTQEYYIEYGTIIRVTPVNTGSELGAGVGSIAGVLLGAVIGSTIGEGAGNALATVAGGAVGGIAGSFAGNEIAGTRGYEVLVQTDSNRAVSILVNQGGPLNIGQRVRVYMNQRRSLIEPIAE